MSKIKQTIATAKADGRKLLIPYLVAGDPSLSISLQLMHELVRAGSDIIELGIPFSDPSSDGEVIQLGAERALAAGTTLSSVLQLVAEFRQQNNTTPVVLMGYLNPVEVMGYEAFVGEASKVGVDGVLLVDMPPSESVNLARLLEGLDMDLIFLVAPTTSDQRTRLICERASGYLYYVSLKGVTGASITDTGSIAKKVAELRQITQLPIVIGFGIKDEDSAAAMAELADGVVIGSALVSRIDQLEVIEGCVDSNALSQTVAFITSIRKRLDNLK